MLVCKQWKILVYWYVKSIWECQLALSQLISRFTKQQNLFQDPVEGIKMIVLIVSELFLTKCQRAKIDV